MPVVPKALSRIRLWNLLVAACYLQCGSGYVQRHSETYSSFPRLDDQTYDYVIVGGGVAGMVLAEQLSENPDVSILLLEAGPDGTGEQNINIPALAGRNEPSAYTWNYTSVSQPSLNGKAPPLAQGHALGGGSAVNYMAYCRGAPSVFDQWANESGDPGLAWENLYHDFKASVRYEPANLSYPRYINYSVYGDGPLTLSDPELQLSGFDPNWYETMKRELDLPPDRDLNAGYGIGVTYGKNSIRPSNRTRDYALEAYGWQTAGRPNIQILHGAWASVINFEGRRAQSVDYVISADNCSHTARAKEVIVTAGAIGSPKLLMLSGIGPATHLNELGIPLVADSPGVGSNMWDHHYSIIEVEVYPNVSTQFNLTNEGFFKQALEQYNDTASGILASLPSSFSAARIPNDELEAANNSFYLSLPEDRGHILYQYSNSPFLKPTPNVSTVSAWATLVQPEAPGSMKLNSSHFEDSPLIDSNYFGSQNDMMAILWGYKKLRAMLQSDHMSSVVKREIYPGPNVTTDGQLMDALKYGAQSFHHPIGTVSLGRVLDSHFRVKGVEGLRVVDSSTFPYLPTCHTQASVYAVARRVARMIKEEPREL